MDITLINPPEKAESLGRNSQSTCTWRVLFSPLGLMYIQAAIEKALKLPCRN